MTERDPSPALASKTRDSVGGMLRRAARATRRWVVRIGEYTKLHQRPIVIGSLLFLGAALVFRLARLRVGYWTIDDAGITFAAAYELADHGSVAAYVEGTPVESYSNPLLFFVVTLLRFCGLFDPVRTHLHLEMVLFATMITLVWSMLRAWTGELAAATAALVFAAIQLVTPATWVWYGSGLENVWVSTGLVTLLWICARTAHGKGLPPASGGIAFLVAITRPEAPAYVVGFYVALTMFARPSDVPWPTHLRRVAVALVVTTALYFLFLCWRRFAYGDWWTNTYYAKVSGDASLGQHFRDYVLGQVLRYGWSALFALSVVALLLAVELERIAYCVLLFLLTSLTLPITAGADWMGEHRFATSFFVVSHVAYATLLAVCVTRVMKARSPTRMAAIAALAAALVVPALLFYERATREKVAPNDVTIGHIARDQGGVRWLHQMRLGLPYPVVMVPDAGGSLLVGGMQFVDSASLADFQLPRILRDSPSIAARLRNQYQHEEKRPDLIHFNLNSAAVDRAYLGTKYLQNESHLAARRDLIELSTIDPAATLLFEVPELRIYLSPETIRRAAPGAFVRCELIVAWTGHTPPASTHVRISTMGDHDEIALEPYQLEAASGIERRGMLIGAPRTAGTYSVVIALSRDGNELAPRAMFDLRVTSDVSDLEQVATELTRAATPRQAVRRIAWLREQTLQRFSTQYLNLVLRALYRGRFASGTVGRQIERLRWNARLAGLEPMPVAMRNAEDAAAKTLLATCSSASPSTDLRILCLGRAVDELRRLGYLGVVAHNPAIADELRRARATIGDAELDARYRMLVGLTLADPSDVDLQRALLASRRAVAFAGPFPDLPTGAAAPTF